MYITTQPLTFRDKYLAVAVALLMATGLQAQTYSKVYNPISWQKGVFDSLGIPTSDTVRPLDVSKAWLTRRPTDKLLYYWNGTAWINIGGGGGGDVTKAYVDSLHEVNGSDLSAVANIKLNSTDTANHWIRTLTNNATGDSLIYYIGSTRYAIKDNGGGGASLYVDTTILGDATAGAPLMVNPYFFYKKAQVDSINALNKNIYSSNGTLTGNRTLSGDDKGLFLGTSSSPLGVLFATVARNNGAFQIGVKGEGTSYKSFVSGDSILQLYGRDGIEIPNPVRASGSRYKSMIIDTATGKINYTDAAVGGGAGTLDATLTAGNTTARKYASDATLTNAQFSIGDKTRTMVQDTVPFIQFQTTDKGGYPSVAPRKMLYSIDPSPLGGALTSKHGRWNLLVGLSPALNQPSSDTGDVVFSEGYNYVEGTNYKSHEPQFGNNWEIRFHQGVDSVPGSEFHKMFLPPNNRYGKGVHTASGRVQTGFYKWDGTEIAEAFQVTNFSVRDTAGRPSFVFIPSAENALSQFKMDDSSKIIFGKGGYSAISQNSYNLIGQIDTGVALLGGVIVIRSGAQIVPSAGNGISLGSSTRPNTQGINLYSNNSQMLKLNNTLGADIWELRKTATEFQLYNSTSTFTPFTINKDAPNSSLAISATGQIGIGGTAGPYKFNITGTSGGAGISLTGINTAGDIGLFQTGTITGNVQPINSTISATGTAYSVFRNTSTASGAESRVEISTASTAGNASAYLRLYTTGSDWSLGTRRGEKDFQISAAAGLYSVTAGLALNYTTNDATFGGKVNLIAATTSKASLNIPSGTAPTTPNNGDIWFDGTDIKIRVGGVTKTFSLL